MKKYTHTVLSFILIIGLFACAAGTNTNIKFTHGQKVPDQFINVLNYSPTEIEFNIRVKFRQERMYHIILDQEENRLSEGWYRTALPTESSYTIKLEAKDGIVFKPETGYRLCIGSTSPDLVGRYQSSYKCYADFEFMLQKK